MGNCKGLKGQALKKCLATSASNRSKKKDSMVGVRTKKRDSIATSRHKKRIKAGTPTRSTSMVSKKAKKKS
tara:strand:+ start:1114 stop:1326 length:213 start_codon:yes stop_codon:yes gene_type:complete